MNVIQTFVSRFLILILNFGLVIYSTNMWGSDGKGIISMLVADLTIISFISNIFVGSSVTYFASKYKTEQILLYGYLWSVIVGILVPLILGFSHGLGYTPYLIGLSVLSALLTTNINLFVGQQNIRMFNLYTILQQAIHILFLIVIIYLIDLKSVTSYFLAQIGCFGVLFLISFFQVLRKCRLSNVSFSVKIQKSIFDYGWKTQLSAFLQFLNYRSSFYFLEFYRGIASVGVFSIGVAFSEAIWTVSRSLSVVLYSDIVNSEDRHEGILKTKISLRISFAVTLAFLIFVIILPSGFYTMIFGKDFQQTKQIILFLSPGILAIAVSNIVGFYFAGINKLRILNVKSIIGLIFTLISSVFVIPRWGIVGACVITTISYCLSSAVLLWKFYQTTTFHLSDLFFTKVELQLMIRKISNKR